MKTKFQKYPAYKDSGVEWLGEIPEGWEILPGLSFITEGKDKNKGMKRNNVLSLSYGNIREKPDEELTGLVPESFETYQLVNIGDIIFRPTDLQNDKVSLRSSISNYDGIITSAYLNLRIKHKACSKFYHYLFRAIDNNKVIYGLGSGLRQNISYLDFRRFLFPFPPHHEQTAIANFLDDKTAKIDQIIAQKEKMIALLKERKQIIIQNAVTKGLDPKVKLKDSGVEWIGEIPEHWEVKRLKYVLNLRNEKVSSLNSDLEYVGMENIESKSGRYIKSKSEVEGLANSFEKGNILFGKLRPYLAKVHLAEFDGICSTEFLVYQSAYPDYFSKLLLTDMFIQVVNASTYGAKMPRASSDFIGNLEIPIPLFEEQIAIVQEIKTESAKIDKAITLQQTQIEKLKEYKATLIDSAVTGKIKVGVSIDNDIQDKRLTV